MPTIQPLTPRCLRWILIIALLFLLPGPLPALANLATAAAGSDGTGFDPFADEGVYRMVVQPDGMILVAGPFTTLNGQPHSGIGRLYPDGRLDSTFNAQVSSTVRALLLQPDGKIVIGGDFTVVNGQPRSHLARLNPDGSLDETFTPGADDVVFSLLWQPENKILVGGTFSLLGGGAYPGVGRLNLDGSLDETFHAAPFDSAGWQVYTIASQSDGRLLVGGNFTITESETQTHNNIARLSANGVFEDTFDAQANSMVTSILAQGDQIIIGGLFWEVNGQSRLSIARLNASGALDETFTTSVSGWIFRLLEQPDGKLLVGGDIYSANTVPCYGLTRLNADGSLDTGFNPRQACPADTSAPSVYGLAIQSNGKILVSGLFTRFGCQPRANLARLFPDGRLDYTKRAYLPLVSLR